MAQVPSRLRENPLTSFRSMFDEFFNEPFFRKTDRDLTGRVWPRVDIIEQRGTFIIRADLPGLKRDDIDVSVEGDVLTISGEKKEETREMQPEYSHLERTYGSFCRSFTLPDYVDKENVEAMYTNGILELRLRKTREPERRAKQIQVKG